MRTDSSSPVNPASGIKTAFAHPAAPKPGSPLFSFGFRPFFLLAGLFAVVAIGAWILAYTGKVDLGLRTSPALWHAHEMLFGYTSAAMAGFFLTVVPNWTRVQAKKGPVLIVFAALWLLGRVVMWGQGWLPYPLVALGDMSFLVVFSLSVSGPLLDRKHRRQAMFVLILLSYITANAMMHLGASGIDFLGQNWSARGILMAIDTIVVLITVMGGRVTPSFTSSYIGHADPSVKVIQRPSLERAVMIVTWGLLVVDQIVPASPVAGGVALLAAALHLARMSGWQSWRTRGNPILWVLHLGYLWVVIGLVLKGIAVFGLMDAEAALHGLTIGGIGTITLAIMTRASLGHTGRAVKAAPAIVAAYVLVSIAALARLAAPFLPMESTLLVVVAGVAWMAAFSIFVLIYAPILVRPRADGRPG